MFLFYTAACTIEDSQNINKRVTYALSMNSFYCAYVPSTGFIAQLGSEI